MQPAFFALCLCSGLATAAPVPVPPPAAKPAQKPIGPEYEPHCFLGRVIGHSTERLTLKPEGHLRLEMVLRTPDGQRDERYFVQDNNQPNRVFVYADRLLELHGVALPANRRQGEVLRIPGEHTIADVRLNDLVGVSYQTIRGEVVCTTVTIQRRPGGRVPDGYGDAPDRKIKSSTTRNAAQCVEETIAGKWAPRLLAGLKK